MSGHRGRLWWCSTEACSAGSAAWSQQRVTLTPTTPCSLVSKQGAQHGPQSPVPPVSKATCSCCSSQDTASCACVWEVMTAVQSTCAVEGPAVEAVGREEVAGPRLPASKCEENIKTRCWAELRSSSRATLGLQQRLWPSASRQCNCQVIVCTQTKAALAPACCTCLRRWMPRHWTLVLCREQPPSTASAAAP